MQMYFLRPDPFDGERWSLAAFSLLAPALIIFRHRSNLLRLWQGKEERYRLAKRGESQPVETPSPPA
jgi:glycerol-3-phosphate acyltransferase PlsY